MLSIAIVECGKGCRVRKQRGELRGVAFNQ